MINSTRNPKIHPKWVKSGDFDVKLIKNWLRKSAFSLKVELFFKGLPLTASVAWNPGSSTTGSSHCNGSGGSIFSNGFRLVVKERLIFDNGPLIMFEYGYEVWQRDEKVYWYDSQPHPQNISLASTDPELCSIRSILYIVPTLSI